MREKIREYAHYLHADGVKRGIDYKGYKVYVPVYEKEVKIGLPYVIFEKNRKIRLSTITEAFDYLDYSLSEISK